MLFTIWAEGMPLPAVSAILDAAIGSLEGWERHVAAGPEHRTEADLGDVDFELDRDGPEPFETDYWAPDDPEWAARGVTGPDMLSFIQRLASEDHRVARTLKNGKHDNVMTYIERITSDDPRTLPRSMVHSSTRPEPRAPWVAAPLHAATPRPVSVRS